MSEKAKLASAKHDRGYNCAQAVACSFAEELGIDERELFRMMEGFGFGMGCMEICGAVSGMTAVAGLKESDGSLEAPATKKASYKASKKMVKEFEEKIGSIICKDIKGVETGKVLRSCDGCVRDAAEIAEKYLKD
ncbi:MAG: C-GCAxxG-C-C family protein [Lentihominibacter sp.]|nr:C-GCAxxG-C-C family protein [Lentihominibacter sp.]